VGPNREGLEHLTSAPARSSRYRGLRGSLTAGDLRQGLGTLRAADQLACLRKSSCTYWFGVEQRRQPAVDPVNRVGDHHLRLRVDLGEAVGVDGDDPPQPLHHLVA
jgi:hypothetical protein